MLIRDLRIIEQELHGEGERRLARPFKRVAACAVLANPYAGQTLADHEALVARSVELGTLLTARAMERIAPMEVTGYAKGVLVGTAGDLEQGAAMIHVRVGRTMRAPLRRGYALIPGTCKIAAAGQPIDLNFGGVDDAWDYDAMDTMTIALPDAPRPDEIVLILAFSGPRPFARIRGASSDAVKALVDELRGQP
jgi:hypothetical protein